MRLDQTLGDGQSQAHPRRRWVHADKLLENLLMKLGGDPAAGIRDGNQHAVGTVATAAAAVGGRRGFRNATLPEVRFRKQGYTTLRWSVLQSVVQEICNALLHFLVVKLER